MGSRGISTLFGANSEASPSNWMIQIRTDPSLIFYRETLVLVRSENLIILSFTSSILKTPHKVNGTAGLFPISDYETMDSVTHLQLFPAMRNGH